MAFIVIGDAMKPVIENIWLSREMDGRPLELRLDWNNGRHHAATIPDPKDKFRVAQALKEMAGLILRDIYLDETKTPD